MASSQSFASLLQRPNHAKVRSTTQRRAITTKPIALSGRRLIWIAGLKHVKRLRTNASLVLSRTSVRRQIIWDA